MDGESPAHANCVAETRALDCVEARMADGASILVRRMSRHNGVRLILSHGNGLAIDGFEEFWRRLLPHAEVIVFDFRNHGVNPPAPPSKANNWSLFVSDLDEILRVIETSFGARPTFGVFHSMSALTSLLHASEHAHPWKGLVLFEPPAVPSPGYREHDETLELHRDLAVRTRRRRAVYESPDQLSAALGRLLMFQRMPDAVRRQLARATLRPAAEGKFALCCPPNFEADTFSLGELKPHWQQFSAITCPVLIVSSAPDGTDMPVLSRISRLLAADFGFQHVELADCGHLPMLDHAERCSELVMSFVRAISDMR